MNEEIAIAGVYVPTFGLACACALATCFIASSATRRFIGIDLRKYAWHPALFDFAVFVILTKIFYAVLGKLPL
ncbi:DUF1656 domain-containing protein [Rhodopseudomonas palustris]|uniref:DUF1656 domain-containing protein n=1 Tax=Rhodopseudomonas palustris TaxID=1076 RepID=UPI0020CFBC5A|nr:DUF1656 domain-containing protein [Rhodopseudomonas palustris]MCP9629015.1 DUF1656 domain-containing protein [Rhodopseudomonas palustris]